MTSTPLPATKLIEVRLSALVRLEHTEVVEVPADITDWELQQLVNQRYQDVDGGLYTDDPDYWERASCYATDADAGDTPTVVATRDGDQLHVETIEAPNSNETPGDQQHG